MVKNNKPEKIMTSLYIEKNLRDQLKELEEDRSFGWLVNHYLKKGLDSERGKK
jgi:hypothetical protein